MAAASFKDFASWKMDALKAMPGVPLFLRPGGFLSFRPDTRDTLKTLGRNVI
jgi:hypothetical protein